MLRLERHVDERTTEDPLHLPGAPDDLDRELERSRRYGHPLSIVRIVRPAGRAARRRRGLDAACAELSAHVRAVDRVWTDGRDLFLLLPESDRGVAAALVARLMREQPEPVGGRVDARIACFPEDGLTSGALVRVLRAPDAGDRVIRLDAERTERLDDDATFPRAAEG